MQLDRLTLPDGGYVEFRDSEELTTRQYLAVKGLLSTDLLTTISRAQTMLAQMLISRWEIPNMGRLPIPSAKKGGAEAYLSLPWKTVQRIEGAVTAVVNEMLLESEDAEDDADDEEKKGEPISE